MKEIGKVIDGLELEKPSAEISGSESDDLAERDLAQFNRIWRVREEALTSREILLQAKALVLCGLPYKRTDKRSVTRKARLGPGSSIAVTFTAIGENGILPYGADRALLGWIQTRAYNSGFVEYRSLREFFTDFGLNDSGANYQRFKARTERLMTLAISVEATAPNEKGIMNLLAVKRAFFPKGTKEARRRLKDEQAGQLLILPERYGFQLDPDFWEYFRANPVPLPLPLMRLFHSRPKGWDLAQFLLYRCYAARSQSVIPWQSFHDQLGSEDANRKQLKRTLIRYLDEIKTVYPNLPARFLPGFDGLEVAPWRGESHR